jgi:hypothetical protein
MNNIDKLSNIIAEWLSNIVASVLPSVKVSPTSGIGKMMNGLLGIDLSTYNVWNELGFLATPVISSFSKPMLQQYLSLIPEEQIKDVALNMVNAMVEQANMKGHINIFGVEVGRNAFDDLHRMIENM